MRALLYGAARGRALPSGFSEEIEYDTLDHSVESQITFPDRYFTMLPGHGYLVESEVIFLSAGAQDAQASAWRIGDANGLTVCKGVALWDAKTNLGASEVSSLGTAVICGDRWTPTLFVGPTDPQPSVFTHCELFMTVADLGLIDLTAVQEVT